MVKVLLTSSRLRIDYELALQLHLYREFVYVQKVLRPAGRKWHTPLELNYFTQ